MRKRLLAALLAALSAVLHGVCRLHRRELSRHGGADRRKRGGDRRARRYDFIFALDEAGELFSGGSGENGVYRYALLDGAGERLTEQEYDMLTLEDGVVVYTQGGLYGAMTTGGEELTERPIRSWSATARAASSP